MEASFQLNRWVWKGAYTINGMGASGAMHV